MHHPMDLLDHGEFDMPEPKRLLVAGDWHGNSHWAIKALKHARLAECDTVLQLGDFGFWPTVNTDPQAKGFYKGVIDYCRQSNLRLFWVDGNHENHQLLNPGLGNEVIRHLPRGYRWQWWSKTWMAVGGGVSVDKKWRRPNVDWFPEETLTADQLEYCLRDGGVDIVVAHDAPEEAHIPGIHAAEKLGKDEDGNPVDSFFPIEQIQESWAHRGLMSEIAKATQPDFWFHGHYHRRYNEVADVGGHPIAVVGLDCDGSHLNLNTVILTEKDLV